MKNLKMVKTMILIIVIFTMFIVVNAEKITVEQLKNKLESVMQKPFETYQGEIEIEMDGKTFQSSKIYIKGKMQRMEIPGNPQLNISDMIIVSDSQKVYMKNGNQWQEMPKEQDQLNQMNATQYNNMLSDIIKKNNFKIEDYKNNKVTITYKEEHIMGTQNVRMGINLENGDLLFMEVRSNQGNSLITFTYDKNNGYRYIKEMIFNVKTENGSKKLIIRNKNVKINKKLNDKLFEVNIRNDK